MRSQSSITRESIQLNSQTTGYGNLRKRKLREGKNLRSKKTSLKEIEKLAKELQVRQIELQMQNDDLHAAQKVLEESRNRYAELFDFAPIGYFSFDEKGEILEANLTGAAQLGVVREQIIRRPFIAYVDEECRIAFDTHLKAVFENRTRQCIELKINRTLNEEEHPESIPFYAELDSLYFETARGKQCLAVLKAITKRKDEEGQIQKMNEMANQINFDLQEITLARNRFFSFISHELKTPLNSIIGYTQLLSKGTYGPINPDQQKAFLRQSVSERNMVQLINNILDMAKTQTAKIAIQRIKIDIWELLEKISLPFEPLFKEKGLSFKKKIDSQCPRMLLTDPEKVRSIVTNLLSNAIKFTKEGRIVLAAVSLPKMAGIRLSVSDTGTGIKTENLERIFEEYEQSEAIQENPAWYTNGSGLGLSIVKTMVSLLGGAIDVKSTVGKGTTFIVDLPEP
ncbi:MAG: PAS domain-containing sensor histidine kinase [Candidatus Manganitrophus sp. SA1]|nr:PAS domain-containing sensor histidine kinase [Candidatus Manganitrophus morganii]